MSELVSNGYCHFVYLPKKKNPAVPRGFYDDEPMMMIIIQKKILSIILYFQYKRERRIQFIYMMLNQLNR